jgi:hypothetical protein
MEHLRLPKKYTLSIDIVKYVWLVLAICSTLSVDHQATAFQSGLAIYQRKFASSIAPPDSQLITSL